jgi:hypothetical protein
MREDIMKAFEEVFQNWGLEKKDIKSLQVLEGSFDESMEKFAEKYYEIQHRNIDELVKPYNTCMADGKEIFEATLIVAGVELSVEDDLPICNIVLIDKKSRKFISGKRMSINISSPKYISGIGVEVECRNMTALEYIGVTHKKQEKYKEFLDIIGTALAKAFKGDKDYIIEALGNVSRDSDECGCPICKLNDIISSSILQEITNRKGKIDPALLKSIMDEFK